MTRREAIEWNKNLKMYMKLSDRIRHYKFLEDNYIALDMAIQALEQDPCEDVSSEAVEQKSGRERGRMKFLEIGKDIYINVDRIDGIAIEDNKVKVYVGGSDTPWSVDKSYENKFLEWIYGEGNKE